MLSLLALLILFLISIKILRHIFCMSNNINKEFRMYQIYAFFKLKPSALGASLVQRDWSKESSLPPFVKTNYVEADSVKNREQVFSFYQH